MGRRVPNRRGQGGRLRADLVEAASSLLGELAGEEALSLRAVARRAGVAPQSVYLHFADRRALLTEVYRARFADLVAALTGAGHPGGARDRLRAMCRAYCRYGREHPGHYRVLFGTAGTPDWEPHEMVGLRALEILDSAVRACRSGGDPGPVEGREALPATVCLWAGLHGLVTLRRDRPSFPWPDLDELIDVLIEAQVARSVR
ncbi:TetR/AcrR family transcriptional regulator [Pseudonocardia acaciae]|uniref:TetR/AcrR family transcriptional regulator n=1 Tax=Pseudonocardia acaciae TaxID=551276 RepID=UPI000A67F122|nr:TetR/AcrR family transcriptional regulator [Pseudonocardia acaciae]